MIEDLYNRYYRELFAWCKSMTGGKEALSEDLIQEVFLRAMKHEKIFEELSEKQCRAWLYRTTRNLYIDHVRHGVFETSADLLPEPAEETEEYSEIDCSEMLKILPDEERVLFVMRYLEGYTSSEIGRIFQIPEGTVRSRLASARRKLRQSWN